jgi:small GTP-binding protein
MVNYEADFFQTYTPFIYGAAVLDVPIKGHTVQLGLWDTGSRPQDDRLRPLSYISGSVILLCFAINQRDSLRGVQDRWLPELAHFCFSPRIPFILVGCKKDLRQTSSADERVVANGGDALTSEEEGEEMARRVGALKYMECSSKTGEGVVPILNEAALASLPVRISSRRARCILL